MNIQDTLFGTMIEAAAKAPSGHNTQPWLFEVKEHSIIIHPDMNQSLPVVDPDNRELFISLGAAAENLCLKASESGYECEINIDPERKTITVNLSKSVGNTGDPLAKYIGLRQTNKKVYSNRIIPDNTIQQLRNIPLSEGSTLHIISKDDPLFMTLREYIRRGNEVQMSDPAFKEELIRFMRFNEKEIKKNPSGLAYYTIGSPGLPSWISKPIVKSFLNPSSQNKSDLKKIDSSSHLVLFAIQENTLENWINTGRDLQRFLLETTRLGIANAYMNQACEVVSLAKEMQKNIRQINGAYPVLLLRIGYAEPAKYSPRKPLEFIILQ